MRTSSALFITFTLALVSGCARYEHRLTEPPDLARHIGVKNDQLVAIEPLEYRMRTVENRLVVRAFNVTDEPIELLGDKSFVVDPSGQSRPLRGQTIAPRSFIKLILPPMRPRVQHDSGPNFGIGLGVGVSHHHHRHRRPYYHSNLTGTADEIEAQRYEDGQPLYLYYDDGDDRYWDWDGEGNIRLTLVYRRGEAIIRHEMAFKRIKM